MAREPMHGFGNLLKTGRIVRAAAMIAIFLSTHPATAAEWSFDEHPHPSIFDYTKKERRIARSLRFAFDIDSCLVSLLSSYRIYRERYPDYEKTGDPITNFENWKRHLVHSDQEIIPTCLFYEEGSRFHDMSYRRPFFFCGRSLDEPEASYDENIEMQFAKLLDFANSGRSDAVYELFDTQRHRPNIALNPDVEFYFRRIIRTDIWLQEELRDTSHLEPHLDAERKAFVEKAVKTRDLAAVMATTAPCNPPPLTDIAKTRLLSTGSFVLRVFCLQTGLGCQEKP